MTSPTTTALALKVVAVRDETPLIRRIVFASHDSTSLPGYAAGAHVTFDIPGVGARKYSLVNPVWLDGGTRAPRTYIVGIRRDDNGEGGSRYMHTLREGDSITASEPGNDFAVAPATTPVLLLGGGIGITPLITMAAEMQGMRRPFRMIYAARSRTDMAFLPEIEALCGANLQLHCDDTAGTVLDLDAVFQSLAPDVTVYACGPKPMLKSAVNASRKLKWPANRLKFELFYSVAKPAAAAAPAASAPTPGPAIFEVQLKSSGKIFTIPPDRSILDVLLEAGIDAMHDCRKGECGVCQVALIEGIADHRDSVLSAAEREANKAIQICVSRAKSPKLVIDL